MSTTARNYAMYLIKEPFRVTGGFYVDGHFNSLVVVDGKNYRKRVEILVTNGRKVFLAFKPGKRKEYIIPGGSSERNMPDGIQVIHECQEKAGFTPKDIQYRLTYKFDYDEVTNIRPAWMNKLPILYDGIINCVYTGVFDSYYFGMTQDDHILSERGDWYDIKSIKSILTDHHKRAIMMK